MQQTHKHDKQINQPTQVHILWICTYHPFIGGNWDPRIRSKGNVRRGKAAIEVTLSLPELYSYVSLPKAYCNTWGCWSFKRKTCFSLQSSHLAFNYVWLSCFRFTAIFVKQKWWVPSVSIIVILSCHLCWWTEPHQELTRSRYIFTYAFSSVLINALGRERFIIPVLQMK